MFAQDRWEIYVHVYRMSVIAVGLVQKAEKAEDVPSTARGSTQRLHVHPNTGHKVASVPFS